VSGVEKGSASHPGKGAQELSNPRPAGSKLESETEGKGAETEARGWKKIENIIMGRGPEGAIRKSKGRTETSGGTRYQKSELHLEMRMRLVGNYRTVRKKMIEELTGHSNPEANAVPNNL